MTVISVVTAQLRPWGASPDPAFPEGAWIAAVSALGDGTGGELLLQIDFQKAFTRLSSRLFSLEQLAVDFTVNTSNFWELRTFNMELFERQGIATRVWILPLLPRPNNGGDALPLGDLAGLPIFLGAPARAGVAAGVAVMTDNQAAPTFTAFLQGFFWGPGALTAPGGPQRPPTSIYGA